MSRRRAYFVLAMAAAMLGGCGPAGGAKSRPPGGKKQLRFPVELRRVQAYPVEYAISAVGTVDAFERVEVVARVAGVVDRIAFQEGDRVTTAQVLAEVDPERYRLALAAAKASKARADAALAEADEALERRRRLQSRNPGAITAEEIAGAAAKVRILTAEAVEAKAAVDLAELELRESSVRSPVDGVVQARPVATGQFVGRGATITTLLRRDPLLLRFSVPAVETARLKKGMTARFTVAGHERPFEGIISYVADAADPASRMVGVTARIEEPGRASLKPGSFAEVVVPIDSGTERPVIPQAAVRPSERGYLAFVVEGGIARERIVTLGLRTADGFVEARSGLEPGESLVVRGSEALRDGAQVEVEKSGVSAGSRGTSAGTSNPAGAAQERAP
ncbi:MAG: efflux RND transporter periplasmic adaptor subunit [Candidatus Wallbacteria bacterium]|nr:efflux RND transporter periplasmic adaptor subunit [Candidatus Wallbacteria bacterium]